MARWRTIHRKDSTHDALREAAEAVGAQFLSIDGVIDGLIFYRGKTFLVDFKGPKTKLTDKQQELVDLGWPIHFLRTEDELMAMLRAA